LFLKGAYRFLRAGRDEFLVILGGARLPYVP